MDDQEMIDARIAELDAMILSCPEFTDQNGKKTIRDILIEHKNDILSNPEKFVSNAKERAANDVFLFGGA